MKMLPWMFAAVSLTILSPVVRSTSHVAQAQLLFQDDFAGNGAGSGNVDTSAWRLPFEAEGTFVGRTQFRGNPATDLPQQGIAEPAAADGAVAEFLLNTFSPVDPGNQFLGTDLLSKRNFARGGGISFETRARFKPDTSAGLVGGLFLFDVQRDVPPGSGNLVRDEIDWELLGNQAVASGSQQVLSNFWNEGTFDSAGTPQLHSVSSLDLTQFQNYRVDWTPQSIKWYVNDALVRTQTTDVPDDPMKLHINFWAPDSSFAQAFDNSLQPAITEAEGETYVLQVDSVAVSRFNTTVSDNLLTDGSFETDFPLPIDFATPTTTDTWLTFGNVFLEDSDPDGLDVAVPDQAPDGIYMAKTFGPFNGRPDASGLLQNVPASPGQEFEASVKVATPSGDSILGSENYNTIALSFLDANGNVLREAIGSPDNMVDTNGNDFPLLDGRDPHMMEDLFVEGTVSAIAPEGTAFARVSLFFIQLNNQGGAAWFDDASLVLLSPETVTSLLGDYNGNGVVDAADYTIWKDSFGSTADLAADGNGNGVIDAADYTIWKDNFGSSLSGSAVASVPEPATCTLGLLLLVGLVIQRSRPLSHGCPQP